MVKIRTSRLSGIVNSYDLIVLAGSLFVWYLVIQVSNAAYEFLDHIFKGGRKCTYTSDAL